MGRQYEGIPLASALLFAGIFATLHHILWLPLALGSDDHHFDGGNGVGSGVRTV